MSSAARPRARSYKIENFYDHVKNPKDTSFQHYDNEEVINIKLPARILSCAPSGKGKTNVIMNLMKGINKWHHVILLAKDLDEPLYKHVIDTYRALEKKHGVKILLAINSFDDLPDIDKDFPPDPTENTLAIFDDLICESEKDLAKLKPWFTRGRKKEVTMCFLSQGFFDIPKLIRKNCNYVMLKQMDNEQDLKRIIREYAMGCTPKELTAMYQHALTGPYMDDSLSDQEVQHRAFFMIDRSTTDPKLKYRANFDPIDGPLLK